MVSEAGVFYLEQKVTRMKNRTAAKNKFALQNTRDFSTPTLRTVMLVSYFLRHYCTY